MATVPEWVRVRAPTPDESAGIRRIRSVVARHRLHTVCQEAVCPNAAECWAAGTATFMILGDVCTRACRFCAVATGDPGGRVDAQEPERLAAAVAELGLRYVVLTSVDRDDLEDGGASVYAASVAGIKAVTAARVELLLPDFRADPGAIDAILASEADVLAHNLETVASLTPRLRDRRASYDQSLRVLETFHAGAGGRRIKSGVMVGLGETDEELVGAFRDLRAVGVDTLTIGQYLRPTSAAAPVRRYVAPEAFEALATVARELGFRAVVSGPLVRSSYHAAEAFEEGCA